jgi:hypothetical protein
VKSVPILLRIFDTSLSESGCLPILATADSRQPRLRTPGLALTVSTRSPPTQLSAAVNGSLLRA